MPLSPYPVLCIIKLLIFVFISDADNIKKESQENGFFSAWNLLRITNMLIIVRLLRIIPNIKVRISFLF